MQPLPSGRRLPALSLAAAPAGDPRPLRPRGRSTHLVVLAHGDGCAECAAQLESLARARDALAEWDGRVTVIVAGEIAEAARLHAGSAAPFDVLADPDCRVAAHCGTTHPAVLVADQWGEVLGVLPAGPEHRFAESAELIDWSRFVTTQCPECQGEAW